MKAQHMQPSKAVGLYDPRFEHEACGVGMVARLDNVAEHEVVRLALTALENLEHRGASGADPTTGDGAGILMQMPDELLRGSVDFELPILGRYGVLMCFLPLESAQERTRLQELVERGRAGPRVSACSAGAMCRSSPSTPRKTAGAVPAGADPAAVRGSGAAEIEDQDAFERKLYVIRRLCERDSGSGLYVASSSSRTVNYKGMLISYQLSAFFPDLRDPRAKTAPR